MILQKLLFPREETCKDINMYFHQKKGCKISADKVILEQGDILEGDTYFNAFSLRKWNKYTKLKNLWVALTLKGECDIFLCGAYINEKNIICRRKDNDIVLKHSSEEKKEIQVEFSLVDYTMCPLIYVQLKAHGHVELYGGYYYTEVNEKELSPIKIALGICTYHREDFIFKNLQAIDREIYQRDSLIKNNLDIIICDNAGTLPVKALRSEHVTIYKNKNYGGSGGFTRCIMEALKKRESVGYTHMLLMDDDIIFEVSVLERIYVFLKLLKKEYENIAIGGAMLVLGDRIRQFENGAKLTPEGMLRFKNKNLNVSTIRNILVNDVQADNNYNAWCCCCMPFNKINKKNLPLPLFIHMDDVEYGVRNNFEFVNLNGICVWHPFESNMRNTSIVYYDIRNKLIAMASLGGGSLKEYALQWLRTFRSDIFVYNYERLQIVCLAIKDFLEGIDSFKRVDPVVLHKNLSGYNKSWVPASLRHLRNITKPEEIKDVRKKRTRKVLNYFLPSIKRWVARSCDISEADPYRARILYICNAQQKCERVYKKSYIKALQCLVEYYHVKRLIEKKMDIIGLEWRVRVKELYDWNFWTKYLGI